jgi:hypothetical protein
MFLEPHRSLAPASGRWARSRPAAQDHRLPASRTVKSAWADVIAEPRARPGERIDTTRQGHKQIRIRGPRSLLRRRYSKRRRKCSAALKWPSATTSRRTRAPGSGEPD